MIDPKNHRLIKMQIIIWTFFYLFSAFLYKYHYSIKIDSAFTLKYSLITFVFIIINIILIIKLFRPRVEEIEDKLQSKEKKFKTDKEKLEVENRLYQILFDTISDPVCVLSNDLNVFFSNLAFEKYFKIKSKKNLIPLIELTRNLEFQNLVKSSIEQNKTLILSKFSFEDEKSPNRIYYDFKIAPIKFSSHYLCIFHDVTEKCVSDQIREDFVSNFSHEIRTPLTILNAQIQNLKTSIQKPNDEISLNTIFDKIENNSNRLSSLFDDMLNLSAIEKQKELKLEKFDVSILIEMISHDIVLKYPNKSINFEYHFNVLEIQADHNLIEQALINLIDNSIKYSRDNSSTIKIMTDNENDFYSISVSDNGIGMPDETRHRIFERFFRIDSSRNSKITGTGLGLAIVKHIIQKHSGKLKVQSELGIGTNITLFIPN